MDCGYDYNLERSILYILKKCCPGITECTQVKGTTFHPLAPFPTSAVLLGVGTTCNFRYYDGARQS